MNNYQTFSFYYSSCLHIAMPSNIYELLLQQTALFCVEVNQQLHYCNVTPSLVLGTCEGYMVENGDVEYTQPGPPFREGTIGMTTCNTDLTLFGNATHICQDDGTWTSFTRCEYSTTNHAVYWGCG